MATMTAKQKDDVPCNLCGLTCMLGEGPHEELGGLLRKTVHGGYESTPGNGSGALDDATTYTFSLCEFCLDWLFAQFAIPVVVGDEHLSFGDDRITSFAVPNGETWRSAAERVATDEWRRMKQEFTSEALRRASSRNAK